jgi:hypothetical protein
MPNFIIEANIAHYKELLASETDARKIAMLGKLLAEEKAKLAGVYAMKPKSDAAE